MRYHHFFVAPDQIRGQKVYFPGEQARQIRGVLRMREGQQVVALDNQGWQYEVRLEKITSDIASGSIVARRRCAGEPQTRVTLFQAFLKKDNFEWVLQKGTEIGMAEFVPLITQRSVVRDEVLKPAKLQRWERIITEAAEQSGRCRLPLLSAPVALADALASAVHFDSALIPWEGEDVIDLAGEIAGVAQQERLAPASIALFIGPEGGFAEDEIAEARAAGVQPVTLGPRILRAETAAIVATTLVMSAFNELQ